MWSLFKPPTGLPTDRDRFDRELKKKLAEQLATTNFFSTFEYQFASKAAREVFDIQYDALWDMIISPSTTRDAIIPKFISFINKIVWNRELFAHTDDMVLSKSLDVIIIMGKYFCIHLYWHYYLIYSAYLHTPPLIVNIFYPCEKCNSQIPPVLLSRMAPN